MQRGGYCSGAGRRTDHESWKDHHLKRHYQMMLYQMPV